MDPLAFRKQIGDNSADLVNFCQDLKQWGEEMKQKDESLKTGKEPDLSVAQPKVKNASVSSKDKSEKKKTKKSIKSYDYAAWEKYVDSECTKLDEKSDDESPNLTDEYDEDNRDNAMYEKEKGNKYVKNKKWSQAIACYTKAIAYYAYDPIFYANRALCYLKCENYTSAESDCTIALQMDKTYVKAYQRRAVAREAINQLTEAHADLLKVFDYEPNNKESKNALTKLEKKLETFNKQTTTTKLDVQRPKSKFTLSWQQQNQNKSKSDNTETKKVSSSSSSVTNANQNLQESEKANLISKIVPPYWSSGNNVELIEPIRKLPHLRSKKPLKRILINNTDTTCIETIIPNDNKSHIWPKPIHGNKTIKCDDLKVIERTLEDNNKIEKHILIDHDKQNSKFKKEQDDVEFSSNKGILNENDKFKLTVPQNSVQFNSDWRLLGNDLDLKYAYLKQINPAKIPVIFKESLDCDVFSGIIHTLAETFIEKGVSVYEYLLGVSQVKRFSMLAMFMSDTDKNDMHSLIDYMRSQHNHTAKDDIDNLINKYCL